MLGRTDLHVQSRIGMAILCYCFACLCPASAETFYYPGLIDSLEIKAAELKKTENRVEFWLEKVSRHSETDLPLARKCLQQCDTLVPLIDDKMLLGSYYYWRAWITFSLNPESQEDELAIGDVDRSLQIFQEEKKFLWKAKAHLLSASIRAYNKDPDGAKQQLEEAEATVARTRAVRPDSLKVLAIAATTLANIYEQKEEELQKAQASLEKALRIYRTLGDSNRVAGILQGMAQLKAPVEAEDLFAQAFYILQAETNETGIGAFYRSKGLYYMNQFNRARPDHQWLEKSLAVLEKAAQIKSFPKADITLMKATDYHLMWATTSATQEKEKVLEKTKQAYLEATAFAKQENNPGIMRHAVENLGMICPRDNSCTFVINQIADSYHAIIDSSIRIAGLAQERQKQYEKRSTSAAVRRQKNNMYMGGSIAFFFLISVFSSVYERQKALRLKRETEAAENKLEALRAQMSPHFFSNNLNIVDSYINLGQPDKASKHVIEFSRLCRKILDNSRNKTVTLKEELKLNHHYLNVEESAFSGELSFDMDIDPEIDTAKFKIPSMLLNPFIENAVKHGIKYKQAPGHLSVRVSSEPEGNLKFVIEDDGVGRERAREIKARKRVDERQSYGTAIAREQIERLNGSLDIVDLKKDQKALGTRVTITLPKSSLV